MKLAFVVATAAAFVGPEPAQHPVHHERRPHHGRHQRGRRANDVPLARFVSHVTVPDDQLVQPGEPF